VRPCCWSSKYTAPASIAASRISEDTLRRGRLRWMRQLASNADVQFAEYLRADDEAAVRCELARDLAGALPLPRARDLGASRSRARTAPAAAGASLLSRPGSSD
jgi:hypothetical protein